MSGRKRRVVAILVAAILCALAIDHRHELFEKRVRVIAPGQLVRGAWQRPWPLRRLIDRERVRTIVTLTAINTHDPKYVMQRKVVDQSGVDWIIVPMRGSTATIDQLAETADLLADPARQPVFFHCVAGHHRTNLALAAYRIRHDGWSAEQAWSELLQFPWTRAEADADDLRLIEAFAAVHRGRGKELQHAPEADLADDLPKPGGSGIVARDPHRLAMDDGQRRHR
ncbi:fused DSP-PTPase phosphatase/NAD kinase-like protein [Tautonia rosea]|uniref:fused DSP-PTPase phosphatase/NAD kinase-like protein n=1 Tax=Tautonia rosea TaxID=2728037 RepID=UPI00147464F4|nr:hypothetical protein [Tautonia rosea]